ncbi:Uncharacterized protein GBIM_08404 [Gryllus bimaculatus]|nr:Uncharacterized protein GBIM_08404 [Gryllus bimaculatus]
MMSSADITHIVGGRAPDFTLDVARAERLLRKIREAKQRRCACRLLTWALALVVFLAAVVAVSMLVTRGQRVFGPL